jgi:membrane protein
MQLAHPDLTRPIERARQVGVAHASVDVAIAVGRQAMADDALLLAGALAYRFFLAIFPFLIFLTALGSYVASWLNTMNPAKQVVAVAGSLLPPQLATVVQSELAQAMRTQDATRLAVSGLASVLFAAGGTYAVLRVIDLAYEVDESRPLWRRWAIAIGLTVLAGAGIVIAFGLFVGLHSIGDTASKVAGRGGSDLVLALLRWPIAFAFLFPAALVIYRIAPNMDLPWRRAVPGAMFFSVAWLVGTWLFALFIAFAGGYGATFGALAGVAILLVWFYLTALMLIVGGELNAVVDAIRHPEEVAGARARARAQKEAAA